MQGHRPTGDAGYRVGLEAMGVGAGIALGLVAAHNRGMAAVERAREEQEWAEIDARLERLIDGMSLELAGEKAENARLRRQLAQAQRWIESQRGKRAA